MFGGRPRLGGAGLPDNAGAALIQPGGKWMARVGKTVWVQPGQVEYKLHYVALEITKIFSVANVRHSIFGNAKES